MLSCTLPKPDDWSTLQNAPPCALLFPSLYTNFINHINIFY